MIPRDGQTVYRVEWKEGYPCIKTGKVELRGKYKTNAYVDGRKVWGPCDTIKEAIIRAYEFIFYDAYHASLQGHACEMKGYLNKIFRLRRLERRLRRFIER